MDAAKKHNVVTQLGNQGHSFGTIRTFCEWIWDGAIGTVHTIHAGCNMVNSGIDELPRLTEKHDVPATLDWDQWLGPALERPYHPAFLPGKWRRWVPFGTGTVGDWTCHVVDPVFWALELGAPATVQADVKDYDPVKQGLSYPKGDIITYQFPATAKRGAITLKWFSGTEHIPRPPELESDEKDIAIGAVVMGDKGTIVYGSHGAGQVRIIPQAKMDAYKKPEPKIPRIKEHHWQWVQCIRNGTRAGSDFSYGGPLTELALLGNIAVLNPDQKLEWDAPKMRFKNSEAANKLINPPRRKGWEL
jgi:predicted dehydrogenase